jgi:hypothetical protein
VTAARRRGLPAAPWGTWLVALGLVMVSLWAWHLGQQPPMPPADAKARVAGAGHAGAPELSDGPGSVPPMREPGAEPDVLIVGVGATSEAASMASASRAPRPLDPASVPALQTLEVARGELSLFKSRMEEAEKQAGASSEAYAVFLKEQLSYQMRVEAIRSLEEGRAVLAVTPHGGRVFGDLPYIAYSTNAKLDGSDAVVAVPMAAESTLGDLRKAIKEVLDHVAMDYMSLHNLKTAGERAAVRRAFDERKAFPGVSETTSSALRSRLRWGDDNYLHSVN